MALRFPLRMVLAYLTGHSTPRPSLPLATVSCTNVLFMAAFADRSPHLRAAANFISRLGDEATATLDTARRQPHRLTGHRGRPRHGRRPDRILARLPQLLRHHPLKPLVLLCDGGVSAESGTAAGVRRQAGSALLGKCRTESPRRPLLPTDRIPRGKVMRRVL